MLQLHNIKTKTITAGQLAQVCHAIQYKRNINTDGCIHCPYKRGNCLFCPYDVECSALRTKKFHDNAVIPRDLLDMSGNPINLDEKVIL